ADFVLVGRAYLYGLMAGGQQGVERAIELLAEEVRISMQLMGAGTVADLGPHLLGTRNHPDLSRRDAPGDQR
ncbi:alpha-hydroxy-acid oxidizing protein, partial [Streptomyces sp.]|uniref:alpha-hydroxy-acid oxidizing protein n=1 Tax=Streptomyces sp. TaxID=1931 RepID=UPI002810FE0B